MEIIEIVFGLLQGLECCFTVTGFFSGAGGVVETARGKKNREERQAAKKAGEKPPPLSIDNWLAILLFGCAALALIFLLVALNAGP